MKKSVWWAALIVLGCTHTKEQKQEPRERKEEEQKEERPAPKPRPAHPPRHDTSKPEDERPPVEEGRPQLSMSPEGLMQPEGPALIQKALARRGFLDGSHQTGELDELTSAALRKFQAAEGLARTGAPDRETVRKLGLSISEVFKQAER